MARDFSKNTSNYLSLGVGTVGPIVNGSAFLSFHCWANVDTIDSGVNDNGLFVFLTANSAAFTARIDGSAGTKVLRVGGRSQSTDGFQARNATSSFTTSTWHSCGGVLDFAGDVITPYFNGVAENSGAATFGGTAYTDNATGRTNGDGIGNIGTAPPATAGQFAGRLAEFAIWFGSRALTADEFAALAKGFSPAQVGPALGRIYFDLLGNNSPEKDLFRGLSGTITGTVAKAAHPRVLRPSAVIYSFPVASGTPITITQSAPEALVLAEQTGEVGVTIPIEQAAPEALVLTENAGAVSLGSDIEITQSAAEALVITENAGVITLTVALTQAASEALVITENQGTVTAEEISETASTAQFWIDARAEAALFFSIRPTRRWRPRRPSSRQLLARAR